MGHKQTMFASQPKAIGFLLLAASAAVIAYSDTMVSPPFAEHLRVEESLKAEPKQSCTAKLPLPAQPSKFSQALKKTLKCGIKGEQTSAKKCEHAFSNAKTSIQNKEAKVEAATAAKSAEKTAPVDRKVLEDACSHSEDAEARRMCMVNEVLLLNTYAMHIEEDDTKVEVIRSDTNEVIFSDRIEESDSSDSASDDSWANDLE